MNTSGLFLTPPDRWGVLFRDRVLLFILLLLTTLGTLDRQQAVASLYFTGGAMIRIAPFFLLAMVLAAYAKASGADRLVARAFSGSTTASILGASLAGALSPFCSCGVIPVIAGMLASGVPLAPVMAFCISSPIMDPEMFLLTAAGIDLPFAVAKTVAAIGMGLLAGFVVLGFQRLGYLRDPLKRAHGPGCGQTSFDARAPVDIAWRFWRDAARKTEFLTQIGTNGWFLGKWMTLAFLLESLMIAYVPAESVAGWAGIGSATAIPVAALFGVPAYMNGYAAIPLVSGLLELGMTPGAALTFVTAGAVSSIPAASAVYALVRPPVFGIYLLLGATGALAAGYMYQAIGV
ncbi:MAG TPA: permease [Desulfosarcina sp.]|nr:permease [Desulfosarcina sp.]